VASSKEGAASGASCAPAPAGEIAFQNKAVVYAILFRAAAETLTTIAADPRHLGAKLGMTMVLHTWGQTPQHHPHVHLRRSRRPLWLEPSRSVARALLGELSLSRLEDLDRGSAHDPLGRIDLAVVEPVAQEIRERLG
jgi:hypothetical protein